jgi:hypothetical protein
MTVYLARVRLTEPPCRWVMFDRDRVLKGEKRESRSALKIRWLALFGRPSRIVRYKGTMSRAELAATMAELTLS